MNSIERTKVIITKVISPAEFSIQLNENNDVQNRHMDNSCTVNRNTNNECLTWIRGKVNSKIITFFCFFVVVVFVVKSDQNAEIFQINFDKDFRVNP